MTEIVHMYGDTYDISTNYYKIGMRAGPPCRDSISTVVVAGRWLPRPCGYRPCVYITVGAERQKISMYARASSERQYTSHAWLPKCGFLQD